MWEDVLTQASYRLSVPSCHLQLCHITWPGHFPCSPCPRLSTAKLLPTFSAQCCSWCKAAFIRAVFTKGLILSTPSHSILINKNPCVMCSCVPEVVAEALQIKVQLPEITPKRCLLMYLFCQNKSCSIIWKSLSPGAMDLQKGRIVSLAGSSSFGAFVPFGSLISNNVNTEYPQCLSKGRSMVPFSW